MTNAQERIADAFADILRNWLTANQWVEMQTRNVDYSDGVCASHDFCDANMAMAQAELARIGVPYSLRLVLADKRAPRGFKSWSFLATREDNPLGVIAS